ncbi:MAG: sec-independent protein translocase protein TatA [Pseudonocardiales bacterium]|jgi:sec-independent protein translocase protein TatA|nr:tatA [Pseudonocardiales bacterium]MDT4958017.1 sec-independent protein translocase protein TatA [Pseudonocardiales bacterium]MDT4960805.1 sec-independent protein translocase protein TatA [Pseudonocardiales bacterium]MDT4976813.1 sec-independent protein translocase protein TatA [Pseudonocardiales bacterium]MDT4980526.1 sec-independent protein translocase protein TatA [Pseudonocardiales bacterium]
MELFSPGHLIPLLIIALVLFFGWKQLPDMARSLGRSLRIFKTEIKGMGEDDKVRDAAKDTQPPAIAPPPAETDGVNGTANGVTPATPAQTEKPANSGQ